jgi:hypothetical protein
LSAADAAELARMAIAAASESAFMTCVLLFVDMR